jgi:hypothetical protein
MLLVYQEHDKGSGELAKLERHRLNDCVLLGIFRGW